MPKSNCERCGHPEAIQYAVCLVNVDDSSFEDGSHVADVTLRLCSVCEQEVADELVAFRKGVVKC